MRDIVRMSCAILLLSSIAGEVEGAGGRQGAEDEVKTSWSPSFVPAEITKVAILPPNFSLSANYSYTEQSMEDEFTQALMEKGYVVATRSEIARVIQEQHFQQVGATDADAVKLGKLLNVSAVLLCNLSDFNQSTVTRESIHKKKPTFKPPTRQGYSRWNSDSDGSEPRQEYAVQYRCSLSARIVSATTGEILWMGKSTSYYTTPYSADFIGSGGDYGPVIKKASSKVAAAIPYQKKVRK